MEAFDGVSGVQSAIGSAGEISERHRSLFEATEHFTSRAHPTSGEWLDQRREPGQTFEQYRCGDAYWPDPSRDTIYIQPIQECEGEASPSIEVLAEFASAYFDMDAEALSPIDVAMSRFRSRIHPRSDRRQVLTTDVVDYLRRRLPRDAFCMIGMAESDLYPKPSWNFVFGQAWPKERTGIYSFARYTDDDRVSTLKRSMKVLIHEIGHLFGVDHCMHFDCAMNGSNNLEEADRRPIHLCPIDLRKLHWACEFDPVGRYRRLSRFYIRHGFDREAAWIERRLDLVSNV